MEVWVRRWEGCREGGRERGVKEGMDRWRERRRREGGREGGREGEVEGEWKCGLHYCIKQFTYVRMYIFRPNHSYFHFSIANHSESDCYQST